MLEKSIRERTQDYEELLLSEFAVHVKDSRGRERPMEPCPIRTDFQRDRDRINHCKSFRRLKHKTQVFLSPEGDHYRTRLTHTLEVSQIARTLARALRLNEDLTEAIALGHDLGHTPFGHAGEDALNRIYPNGFRHSEQSVRVVERLEREGEGLNLTWEVRNGILRHSSGTPAETLEGQVVRFADKIAYMNHDIEDAQRAGFLQEEELPYDVRYTLGRTGSDRIRTMLHSILENSEGRPVIRMGEEIFASYNKLRGFLFETLYTNPQAKGEEGKAKEMISRLYEYFKTHPDEMPQEYQQIARLENTERAAVDYISGMSDRYAVTLFSDLYIPKFWRK